MAALGGLLQCGDGPLGVLSAPGLVSRVELGFARADQRGADGLGAREVVRVQDARLGESLEDRQGLLPRRRGLSPEPGALVTADLEWQYPRPSRDVGLARTSASWTSRAWL
jgi:hypothetical protein